MSRVASRTTDDPRVERTRSALLASFNRQLLDVGYDAASPASVAAAAGVARSTFYEHFAGMPALLRFSVARVLGPLAACVSSDRALPELELVVAHFREQTRLASSLLSGRPHAIICERLAELIAAELKEQRFAGIVAVALAADLVAHQQLGLLKAWLATPSGCDPRDISQALQVSSMATVRSLIAR